MMQTAILYVVITLLMSGVIVAFGLPFIALGLAFAHWTRGLIAEGTRIALSAAIAAIGIAPNYDAYRGPLPIWARLMRGESVTLVGALASIAVTWIALFLIARFVSRRRPSTV